MPEPSCAEAWGTRPWRVLDSSRKAASVVRPLALAPHTNSVRTGLGEPRASQVHATECPSVWLDGQ